MRLVDVQLVVRTAVTAASTILTTAMLTTAVWAEVRLEIGPGVDLGVGGLRQYTISALGSDDEFINVFGLINLRGQVHQVGGLGSPWAPTTTLDDQVGGGFDPTWAAFDSHLLFSRDDLVGQVGTPLSEDNNLATSGSLGLVPHMGQSPASGFGLLKTLDGAYGLLSEKVSGKIPFLQVVTNSESFLDLEISFLDRARTTASTISFADVLIGTSSENSTFAGTLREPIVPPVATPPVTQPPLTSPTIPEPSRPDMPFSQDPPMSSENISSENTSTTVALPTETWDIELGQLEIWDGLIDNEQITDVADALEVLIWQRGGRSIGGAAGFFHPFLQSSEIAVLNSTIDLDGLIAYDSQNSVRAVTSLNSLSYGGKALSQGGVPEPSTLAMLVGAAAGVWSRFRRRARQSG